MPSTHPLVERFRGGDVPEPLKAAAARGALPLAPEDLIEILYLLRKDPSKEIQRDIVRTLEGLPLDAVAAVASSPGTAAPMLDFLARACIRRDALLERVAKHPSTADATLTLLGQHGSESVLEFLSFNQVRLTRAPSIMKAMLANPRLALSVRRRLEEIADLHSKELHTDAQRAARQAKQAASSAAGTSPTPAATAMPAATPPADASPALKAALAPAAGIAANIPAAAAPEPASLPVSEAGPGPISTVADVSAVAADMDDGLPAEELVDFSQLSGSIDQAILDEMAADDASEEELRLAQKLLTMSVPEKVQLAIKGNRDARMVLIRDSNKQVQEAVVNSPKITDNEIERIAKMRSVSEDVIRLITSKRELMKIYSIVNALVHNPKTPQHVSMTLLQQLQNRDLQMIGKDKNIPDVIRRHALITLEKRQPKPTKKH